MTISNVFVKVNLAIIVENLEVYKENDIEVIFVKVRYKNLGIEPVIYRSTIEVINVFVIFIYGKLDLSNHKLEQVLVIDVKLKVVI